MAGYSPALAVFVYVLQAMLGPVANACGKGRMRLVDYLGESRVRENLMHGLGRGCWKQGRSLQVICGSRAGVQECHLWAWSRPSLKVAATAPAPCFTAFHLDQERRQGLRLSAEIAGSDSYDRNFGPGTSQLSDCMRRRWMAEIDKGTRDFALPYSDPHRHRELPITAKARAAKF